MNNKLYFTYAPMNAGKSKRLIGQAFSLRERNHNVVLLKPSIDTREGTNIIKSRNGEFMECILVSENDDIGEIILQSFNSCDGHKVCNEKPFWALIDESQFLTEKQVNQLRNIVDSFNCICIRCYGLRTDFQSKLFEGSKRLMEICDVIEDIEDDFVCDCGRKAIINARIDENGRIVKEGEQVCIGGNDTYISICSKCYSKKNFKVKKK